MNVYVVLVLLFSIISIFVYLTKGQLLKNVFYYISCFTLIALFAMQDVSVGADTRVYCNAYKYIQTLDFMDIFSFGWEPGYVLLNWLLGLFTDNDRFYLIMLAVGILFPIFTWMKKEAIWPELSLAIFVGNGMWLASMGIFRQWCAMAILTYSYKYIKEKKFVPFLGVLILATLFHRTALIFLLAYFIVRIPLNWMILVISLPVSIVIGIMGQNILSILNSFARITEQGNFNGGISILVMLWVCVFFLFIFYNGKLPEKQRLYFYLLYFAAVIQPIAFTFSNWSRIVVYFSISMVILLPNFLADLTKEKNFLFRIPAIILLCIILITWSLLQNNEPYLIFN